MITFIFFPFSLVLRSHFWYMGEISQATISFIHMNALILSEFIFEFKCVTPMEILKIILIITTHLFKKFIFTNFTLILLFHIYHKWVFKLEGNCNNFLWIILFEEKNKGVRTHYFKIKFMFINLNFPFPLLS